MDKVSNLPVSAWVFKSDPEKNHVGPMAQDFHAAFGLNGDDDKHINLTDIAGVSLAAIKELSNEMREKDAQLRVKDGEIAELRQQRSIQNQAMAQMRSMAESVAARCFSGIGCHCRPEPMTRTRIHAHRTERWR